MILVIATLIAKPGERDKIISKSSVFFKCNNFLKCNNPVYCIKPGEVW